MQVNAQLREELYKAARDVEAEHIGIAFSGGLDSSLLAKICKDIGKTVTLLTVGFSSQRDIEISKEVSEILELPLLHTTVPLEDLEHGLRRVLSSIEYDRIPLLENCACFYFVFEMASEQKIHTTLSANGADELFCGYHMYTREFKSNETLMTRLMNKLVETAKKDKEQIDKLSKLFDINYNCPFLSKNLVEFALKIPIRLKIKSERDKVRKHVLRETALEVGVPRFAALRRKKAFQYSSGMHKAIQRLATEHGFTRKIAKEAGYRSVMKAYIASLRRSQVN
jgi:asparagine synthase (glutamine-hydrolysing)